MVELLALAHERSCEADLAAALVEPMATGSRPAIGDDLLVPHASQGIGPRAIDPPLLLGSRRAWIAIDAPAGRERQAGFGCSGDLRVVGAEFM